MATFRYNIPRVSSTLSSLDEPQVQTAPAADDASAPSGSKSPTQICRVLIVEDQDSDFLLLDRMLKKFPDHRFSVTHANNFRDALDLLSKRQFDAALIDYRIGAQSGIDLIRELGGMSSQTPMIVMTGQGDERVDTEAMNAGAADYLDKNELSAGNLERSIRYARAHHDLKQRLQHSNSLLERATEQAETASSAKSDFLASMSHELRTPLNAILGFSEIIKNETLGAIEPSRYQVYAEHIHDSGRYLLNLVNGILDLAKIEAGKFELSDDVVDLSRLVSDALTLVEMQAEEGRVALESKVERDLPRLRADSQTVTQMLLNLLSNAVKFTPEGGVVTVAAYCEAKDICIAVGDSGIGIARADIEKVMMPFGQAENPFQGDHAGTGLGLPIVKSLIELHGGRFGLQSVNGSGTTATLRFPANRVVQTDQGAGRA